MSQTNPQGAVLTQGEVAPALFKMSASMLIGFVAAAAFNVTDTYFVAQLGTEPLAAMGYTFPIVTLVTGLVLGIGVGTASLLSRTIGQGDLSGARRITMHALALGLVLTSLLILLGYLFMDPVLEIMGANRQIAPMVRDYMEIWLAGMLFLVIPMIGNNAIRATGDTLSPSLIMATDLGINAILDPVFIFGLGPVPAMGIQGAALATVLARSFTLLASLYVLGKRKKMFGFRFTGGLGLGHGLLDSWKKIGFVGLPAAGTHMLNPIGMGIVMNIVSGFGPARVAAMTAGMRIEMVVVIPLLAMGASLVPFVGQNWGAKAYARVHQAYRLTVRSALIWGAVCMLVLPLSADSIMPFFSNDLEVLPWFGLFLAIMPLRFGLRGVAFASIQTMNAINRPLDASGTTLFRLFLLQWPAAALGAYLWSFPGMLLGLIAADLLNATVSFLWTRQLLQQPCRAQRKGEEATELLLCS